jgi:hypothetical protein
MRLGFLDPKSQTSRVAPNKAPRGMNGKEAGKETGDALPDLRGESAAKASTVVVTSIHAASRN